MARLRQYFASRYGSQEATSSEFENIIRYLNSAEIGNLTLFELLDKIFDDNGDVNLNFEIRYDPTTGLEYRLDADADWQLITAADNLRGAPGVNLGTIESALFFNRTDYVAGVSQTVYSYVIPPASAAVLVWINGVLQAESAYTYSELTSQVTLLTAPTTGATVTLTTIRSNPATAYRRVDMIAASNQVTFPFPHEEAEEIMVWRNGVLQREGGGYDFIKSWQTSTVTMTTAQPTNTLISVICITNDSIRDVAGLMLEDRFCTNGQIRLDKILINDGSIPSAKITGLDADLAIKADIYVSATQPVGAASGSLWVNTAGSIPQLLFFDSVRWLSSSPNGLIPLPQTANALQYVRLNSTATALEYASIDLSAMIASTSRGAANGVAPLDAAGLVPSSALPAWCARAPILGNISGAVANGTYPIAVIEDQYVFDGLTVALSAGTATVQLYVGGSAVGSTVGASTTPTKLAITSAVKDGSTVPLLVALVVTASSGATNLTYNAGALITA
jgi:hypothetical protein